MMTKLLAAARVEPHFVAPYSHQSNGQVENANRRVEHVLWFGGSLTASWCTGTGAPPTSCSPTNSESAAAAEATVAQWRAQHEVLLARCEAVQDELIQKLADLQGPEAADLSSLIPGDAVLVSSDERPAHKLGPRWLGPYLVVSEPVGQRVLLQHLSSKRVGEFALNMCKRCDMSLMSDTNDWLSLAAADHFEYLVESVEEHRPSQRRLPNGRLRPKSDFEFLVRWEGLPSET